MKFKIGDKVYVNHAYIDECRRNPNDNVRQSDSDLIFEYKYKGRKSGIWFIPKMYELREMTIRNFYEYDGYYKLDNGFCYLEDWLVLANDENEIKQAKEPTEVTTTMRFEIKVFDRQGNYLETVDRKTFKNQSEVNAFLAKSGLNAPDLKVVVRRLKRKGE